MEKNRNPRRRENVRTLERKIRVELLDPIDLSVEERELVRRASYARLNAQAPYSMYWVGAAVLSKLGVTYTGCNVERATYTQTTHAEQNASDSMVAAEGRGAKIVALAIVGAPAGEDIWNVERFGMRPLKPEVEVEDFCFACGHCLQIIWENCLADKNVKLLLLTKWGEVARTTIGDAFPMRFGPESLGIDIRKK